MLKALGHLEEAASAYRSAITLLPSYADAHHNLGTVFEAVNRRNDAFACYRRALEANPDLAAAHTNLGNLPLEAEQWDEAALHYRRAADLAPGSAECQSNLGSALAALGRPAEAEIAYLRAIALNPGLAKTHTNLGNALLEAGRVDAAVAAHRTALALDPDLAIAHFNLATSLLPQGNFAEGLEEYEWRWGIDDLKPCKRDLQAPRWEGEPLGGRSIYVYPEQGLGDAINFFRYVPLIAEQGGRPLVEMPEQLMPVFPSDHRMQLFPAGSPPREFDVHCPMLSLPRVFRTRVNSIPAPVPYAAADPGKVALWRGMLSQGMMGRDGTPMVAVIWASNRANARLRKRSIPLATLARLFARPGIRFVSLQKDALPEERAILRRFPQVIHAGDLLEDFSDTAALMALADLVVTVDTGPAHLAGAMGRPT